MTKVYNEPVPLRKWQQFHEILCATGGRYLGTPTACGDEVRVSYEPGDYRAMQEAWLRCMTPVREARRDQWWRRLWRRMTYNCGCSLMLGAVRR